MVKRLTALAENLGFGSQHPKGNTPPPPVPVPRDSTLFWPQQAAGMHAVHFHTHRQTIQTHKLKLNLKNQYKIYLPQVERELCG